MILTTQTEKQCFSNSISMFPARQEKTKKMHLHYIVFVSSSLALRRPRFPRFVYGLDATCMHFHPAGLECVNSGVLELSGGSQRLAIKSLERHNPISRRSCQVYTVNARLQPSWCTRTTIFGLLSPLKCTVKSQDDRLLNIGRVAHRIQPSCQSMVCSLSAPAADIICASAS